MTSKPRQAFCILDGNWDSTVRLFEQLADQVPLYFVKTRTIQQARASGWTFRSCLRARPLAANQFERRFMFPSGWFSALAPVFMPLLAGLVRREMQKLNLESASVVITYPQYLAAARKFKPARTIYYCVDDYRGYWPARARQIEVMENQVIQEVDLVLCTAKFMQEEFIRRVPGAAAKIHHLPNGTRESFLVPQPLLKPDPLPEDLAHIPGPVLGYLGSISGRINWDIVEAVLKQFPSASVVFIGPPPPANSRDADLMSQFKRYPNFHFVGPRPQEKIMTYIRAFDICLIPEPYEPLNIAGCPQKLWNYLASSRPVVSTDVPEQAMWSPAVCISQGAEDFCEHIARLMACGGQDGQAGQRLEIARNHIWPRLAEKLRENLDQNKLVKH